MTTDFRCSAAAEERGDALAGTASVVRAFLLVENPGPWGVSAFRDSRWPEGVGTAVQRAAASHRIRPLMIRRGGRPTETTGLRVVLAWAGPEPWLEATVLAGPEQVLDLDLAALGEGRRQGLEPWAGPLYLVCTHGRHDACCAERGRPLALALQTLRPDATWECSHLGGDRFAGNVAVLPTGLYYGRVSPRDVLVLVEAHESGRLDLAHLRGRTGLPMPVQYAEHALRERLREDRIDAVTPLGHRVRVHDAVADFATPDGPCRVVVEIGASDERFPLTCKAVHVDPVPRLRIRDVRALPDHAPYS